MLDGKSIAVKEENRWDQMAQEEDIILPIILPIIGTKVYAYSHVLVLLSTLFIKLLISKSSS